MDQAKTIQPFAVDRNNRKYTFDPENMTIMQWEGAEKEITDARYYDLLRKHSDFHSRSENRFAIFDPEKQEQLDAYKLLIEQYQLSVITPKSEWTDKMKDADEYMIRRTRMEEHWTSCLREFHQNLISNGGRLRLVEALLVDPNIPLGNAVQVADMRKKIREEVVPTLKLEEVETVIQNFLNCSAFVEHLSLSYLRPPSKLG